MRGPPPRPDRRAAARRVRPPDGDRVRYFAACSLGVETALVAELRAIGAREVDIARGGAHFSGDRRTGYAAALWLRSALRVQEEIASGRARSERDLYGLVAAVDWSRRMSVSQTLAVEANLRDSFLTHSMFAAQLVKDAVVDQFRRREGRRPNVDANAPDLPLRLLLRRDEVTLYRDLSGASLHKRGYRPVQVRSPLNEATAAGLLLLTGWDRRSPLLDPMCGSGTFAIEAAMLAGDRAPGLGGEFPFVRWPDFEPRTWRALIEDARERERAGAAQIPSIEATDRHAGALEIAADSVRRAGVADHVRLRRCEAAELTPVVPPRLIVANPPYGERLGEGADLERSWRDLGGLLHRCPGAMAFVLCGARGLSQFLGLRATRKWPVFNGPIECRWIHYDVDAAREPGAADE